MNLIRALETQLPSQLVAYFTSSFQARFITINGVDNLFEDPTDKCMQMDSCQRFERSCVRS